MSSISRQLCQLTLKGITPITVTSQFRVHLFQQPDFQRIPRTFQYQQSRNAGHSKWANIKHVKMAKDEERSKDTTKFVSMMKGAIKEGGGSADPKVNSKLAQVIAQIKEAKLSMAAFDKFLQNMQVRKDEKTLLLPIKGPGNCILLVELSTDSPNRSKQEINTILRKNKGIVADDNVLYLFNHKGVILSTDLDGKTASEQNLEEVIVDAIEAGAEDVTFQSDHPEFGNVYEFTTDPTVFYKVKHALEKLKYTISYADVDYIPTKSMELDDTDIQDAHKLYQKLTEYRDVTKVSTNIA